MFMFSILFLALANYTYYSTKCKLFTMGYKDCCKHDLFTTTTDFLLPVHVWHPIFESWSEESLENHTVILSTYFRFVELFHWHGGAYRDVWEFVLTWWFTMTTIIVYLAWNHIIIHYIFVASVLWCCVSWWHTKRPNCIPCTCMV